MKKLLFGSLVLCLISCGTESAKTESENATSGTEAVSYGYPVKYSKFEMADVSYSQKIAELWKDYDENMLDRHVEYFADTITMEYPGWKNTGPRDTMLAGIKADRGIYSSCQSSIIGIISALNTDEAGPRNFVMVWGSEKKTSDDGTMDSTMVNEVWGFNKDGKVNYVSQFRQ